MVVLTPPFLPASLQSIRVLRALRLLRLVRLAKIARRTFSLQGLRYATLLAILTALGGGAAFSSVESGASAWDGVWWAVTTMTVVHEVDVVRDQIVGELRSLGERLRDLERSVEKLGR